MTPPPNVDTKHPRKPPRRFALRAIFEISHERDRIAARVAGCEVSPTAGPHIHLERAGVPVGAGRVQGRVLAPGAFAARYKARKNGWERWNSCAVLEIICQVRARDPTLGPLRKPTRAGSRNGTITSFKVGGVSYVSGVSDFLLLVF
jgi:hypothetical protein